MKNMFVTAVLLCAGNGKRMGSVVPKPLVSIGGRSLVSRIVSEVFGLVEDILLVVQETHLLLFQEDLAPYLSKCRFVFQAQPRGTGDAFRVAVENLSIETERVLCLNGDMPLVRENLLKWVLEESPHNESGIVGFEPLNPHGFGRVVESGDGHVSIIEEKDCTPEQRNVRLANAGVYLFPGQALRDVPVLLDTNNAQKEMYITDYIQNLQTSGRHVRVVRTPEEWAYQLQGVNTREELEAIQHLF